VNRPSKFQIMRTNRRRRDESLRIERLMAEARELGLDVEGDPYEIVTREAPTRAPDRCAAVIRHPQPRRWWHRFTRDAAALLPHHNGKEK
jgi:hypothetical protein